MPSDRSTVTVSIGTSARRPRRGAPRALLTAASAEAYRGAGYEPVQQILGDILSSACGVLGATQAFILVSRSARVLEVACTREIDAAEVMTTVMSHASRAVNTALRRNIMTAGDLRGCVLPMNDGAAEERAPAVLCVPLDLGPQLSGVLCLLRREQPRRLSDLDLEIVQALAEQAALAIGAASHSSALSRLRASLSDLPATHA